MPVFLADALLRLVEIFILTYSLNPCIRFCQISVIFLIQERIQNYLRVDLDSLSKVAPP